MYAWPIACRIAVGSSSRPASLSTARLEASRVSPKQARTAAMNRSFFVTYSWNRYGCETPTRRAIDWVEVPA